MRRWSTVFFLCSLLGWGPQSPAAAGVMLEFIGAEYQAQAGTNAGTIRGGDPASDPAFLNFLTVAQLSPSELVAGDAFAPGQGAKAVWGRFVADQGLLESYSFAIGGTTATARIASFDPAQPEAILGADGGARLDALGNHGTALQSGAPRPGFASGSGSGHYLSTTGGGTSNSLRNGVLFDLSGFPGGGVHAFGVFAGDLETGGLDGSDADTVGSPLGFLRLIFTDNSFHDVESRPDASLFPDLAYSGNNNLSETLGNETTRFLGFAADEKRIRSAVLIVGDDDKDDNGSSEQLSFIAPMVLLNSDGTPFHPGSLSATAVPEPHSFGLGLLLASGVWALRRRNLRSPGTTLYITFLGFANRGTRSSYCEATYDELKAAVAACYAAETTTDKRTDPGSGSRVSDGLWIMPPPSCRIAV